jgi:hypothetical protein
MIGTVSGGYGPGQKVWTILTALFFSVPAQVAYLGTSASIGPGPYA